MQKNTSLVRNATILMIASTVSRVIGLLYRRPLGQILGPVGLGYYGYASNLYAILLLISSYSIPMAVSKIVSERLAKGEFRNAGRVFRGALLYAVLVGGITAFVAFFAGGFLLPQNQQNALPALRVLAPTIFLSAILGVLRGYFQARRSMTPTSVSQILEQIMNAIVSILAAWILVSSFADGDSTRHAVFGAMGGTLGTGAGVLTGLLYMLFVYGVNRKAMRKQQRKDRSRERETYGDIFRIIALMITPIIFTTFIQNASNYLDSYIYASIQGLHGISADAISSAYGEFSNYFQPVVGIPTALASASVSAMMPEVSGRYAIGKYKEACGSIQKTIRLTMFICIPAMVGMTVLAFPIMQILFPSSSEVAAQLLIIGSLYVLTGAMTMITSGVLQSIGRQQTAMINAAISLIANMLLLAVLLFLFPKMDIYAVAVVNFLSSLFCNLLNVRSMRKSLSFRSNLRQSYLMPLLASAWMGAVAFGIYVLLYRLTRSMFIGLAAAIVLAALVYLVAYVIIGRISEAEMRRFPMGGVIVRMLRVLHIY